MESILAYQSNDRGSYGGKMEGWHTMIQWQGRGWCQWPWEWVLYHEICLSPTPSTYSIIIQPIPWLRQMSVETLEWQSHNFESQLICSTHFPCNQFISDIKSLHFLTLAIPRFETLTLTSRDRCRGCKIGKGLKINRKGQRGDFPAFYVLQFCRNFSTILLLNVAHCVTFD